MSVCVRSLAGEPCTHKQFTFTITAYSEQSKGPNIPLGHTWGICPWPLWRLCKILQKLFNKIHNAQLKKDHLGDWRWAMVKLVVCLATHNNNKNKTYFQFNKFVPHTNLFSRYVIYGKGNVDWLAPGIYIFGSKQFYQSRQVLWISNILSDWVFPISLMIIHYYSFIVLEKLYLNKVGQS